jgi:hypothetical protein
MFHLFNGADSAVQIMFRWMRNYSVMSSELVNYVGEPVVDNTSYKFYCIYRGNYKKPNLG